MYQYCIELAKQITQSYSDRFWGAKDAVNKGGTPAPPPTPDYAASTRAGILADVETLPARKQIEAASRAGTAGTAMIGDTEVVFDFTGIGDLDQQTTLLEGQRRSADTMAQVALDIQKKYGADFLDQSLKRIEQSDPTGTKVRKRLAEITLAELEKGTQLSDEEVRFAEQAFRRSSTARGGSQIGTAPAIQETLAQYNMGRQLLGQRMNMARSYMGMPQTGQLSQVAGAQQGAAPFMAQQLQQGIGQNANAMAAGAGFATNVYGTQANIYGTQMANRSDPMATVLGGLAGAAMGPIGGALGSAAAGMFSGGGGAPKGTTMSPMGMFSMAP